MTARGSPTPSTSMSPCKPWSRRVSTMSSAGSPPSWPGSRRRAGRVRRHQRPEDVLRDPWTSDQVKVPVVLLHGAISATGTSFGPLPDLLAQTREVIAVEQQGNGRTADIERPISVQAMDDDTVPLLASLGIRQADLFGYSLGAAIALNIITNHPAVVRKAVLASVSYDKTGLHPELFGRPESGSPQMRRDATCRFPSSRNTGRSPPTQETGHPAGQGPGD